MAPPKKKPTPKTINQAEAAIRSGLSAELAAKTIGISRRTWFRWMKRGKEGERPYTRFVGAVHQAEAELE